MKPSKKKWKQCSINPKSKIDMKIKKNHKKYIESPEGTIRIEFAENHFSDNCFKVDMKFACRKLNNQNFKSIGCAEFYAYVGCIYALEDILYCDNTGWEEQLVLKIWDIENQDYKKKYQKLEGVFDESMVFSLDSVILDPEFRGKGIFKKIIHEFQNMYHFGTILVKPYPITTDIENPVQWKADLKKVRKSYENAGFKSIDYHKEFYYYDMNSNVNLSKLNDDVFKQNYILSNYYNLEHIQEMINDEIEFQ